MRSFGPAPCGIIQTGSSGASAACSKSGNLTALAVSPSASTALRPAWSASARPTPISITPLAAPAGITNPSPVAPKGGRVSSGRNIACSSSQTSLPPQWLQRCTTGDQPPDIATASQAISSSTPPSPACAQILTDLTRLPPVTLAIALPFSTRMPAARAASAAAPPPPARASRITGTSRPAALTAIAVLYASSLLVTTTTRSPALTP